METIIFGQWWRSHQSLACKGLRIFRFCVTSWKVESEPSIKFCLEEKLSWFKSSPEYRTLDTIDGEPMEFEWTIFPGFTICSSSTKSMSSWPKWAIHHNSKDELSSCRCYLTRKVGFEGTPRLDPHWKWQSVTCKYGVEIRIEYVNKDNAHSWVRISHELRKKRGRRQRAGNLWDAVRRICVEDECTCFCKPIKG